MPTSAPTGASRRRGADGRRKWPLAAVCAVALHVALIAALVWLIPTPPTVAPPEPLFVSLREPRSTPQPARAVDEPMPSPQRRSADRPPRHRPPQAASGTPGLAAPEEAMEISPAIPASPPPDLSSIRLEPDPRMLSNIAARDARLRRMTEAQPTGPFARPRRFRRTDLPPELKYLEIKRLMETAWQPDWRQIKDERVSEVSGAWARQGAIDWIKRWQRELREQQEPTGESPPGAAAPFVPEAAPPQDLPETFSIDFAGDPRTIAVLIDVEPLRDGGWHASIAQPSGHPFFDRHALEQIGEVANLFPPWPAGYGAVARYRLEARFVIVPPSTSTLFGLSCAFPFCTPEELKELEVIHWFKKLISTNVYFEGLLEAPELDAPDGGSAYSR